MSKKFTKQQREVLARKLGYDGPMNMFDQFVKSDPAMERKYSTVIEKYMARGGMVKKYQEGGDVQQTPSTDIRQRIWDATYAPKLSQLKTGYESEINSLKEQEKQLRVKAEQDAGTQAQATVQREIDAIVSKNAPSINAYQNNIKQINDLLQNKIGEITLTYPGQGTERYKAGDLDQQNLNQIIAGNQRYIAELQDQKKIKDEALKQVVKKNRDVFTGDVWDNYSFWGAEVMFPGATQESMEENIVGNLKAPLVGTLAEEYVKPIYDKVTQLSREYNTTVNTLSKEGNAAELQGRQQYIDYYQGREKALADELQRLADQGLNTKENVAKLTDAFQKEKEFVASQGFNFTPAAYQQAKDVFAQAYTGAQPTTTPTTTTQTPTVSGTTPVAGTTPTTTTATTTTPVAGTTTPTTGATTPTTGTGTTQPTSVTAGTTATTTAPVSGTSTTATPTATGAGLTTTTGATGTQMAGIPTTNTVPAVNIPQVTAATIPTEPGQVMAPTGAPAQAAQIAGATVPGVAQVTPTAPQAAATMEAATATGAVSGELAGLQPEQGAVSQQAQVQAATMEPTSTALKDLQAAQGVAGQVTGAPTREVVAGELIEGPTVDRAAVEAALAKNEAAQGVVTEDMTVQGQLAKLTTDFEANNPPAWAAGALRNATAAMAQRGLAASSLAGQALIQATIESALPIASADAQIYREMGIQNLTNKQQMAVLSAQQRAAFLGQEFDQAFQTRVTNAATISEIANLNFSAKQQIALENARLTESVNLANLNNRQALVMANAAQIATLETANLNNRQQANVLNAQAFLQMDLTNLSNRQQTALFKSQSMIQSILSDQAAENAARQFNAASENQVNQFYDGLTAQIKQFNATQANAMNQFNVSQINSVSEFNATQQNARDQFNAEYRRVIDQSNAEWRRNIALADTAAINRANEVNANAALGITTIEYNNLWQTYRDQIEYSWKTGENALDRENELARQVLAKQATIEAAKFQIEAAKYQALGGLAAQIFDKGGIAAGIGSFLGTAGGAATGLVSGAMSGINNLLFGVNRNVNFVETTGPNVGWTYYSNGTDAVGIDTQGSVYYNGVLVADDQLAYTGFTPPSGEIDWDIWSSGGMDTPQPEVDNYIFPTD